MLMKYSMAAVAICVALSSTAASARCTGFDKQVGLFKTIAGAVCDVPGVGQHCNILKAAAKQANLNGKAKQALQEWKDLANNGPSTVGPRRINIGANPDHGKTLFPGSRLWITNAVAKDKVKVTIKHTANDKSRLVAELCAVSPNGGKPRWVKSIEFPKKSAKGMTKSAQVALNNESLFVHMLPKTLGRSFTYNISVK